MTVTSEDLHSLFKYDENTGIITRRVKSAKRLLPGQRAGYADSLGYRRIGIKRKYFLEHRLIWCMVTGAWPVNEIDHINGDPSDNRWCNLREATRSENLTNRLSNGYRKIPSGRFLARITKNKKTLCLGTYDTAEEARIAYGAASLVLFGEYRYERRLRG